MGRVSRFPQEVRKRAVRMVFDHGSEYGSEWEAICSIAEKIGCSAETLRKGSMAQSARIGQFGARKCR